MSIIYYPILTGGGGTPGSPTGSIQANNSGVFAGVIGSSVNFSTGAVSLVSLGLTDFLIFGSDTGISRGGAGVLAVGNGTATDASGTVNAAQYNFSGAVPADAEILYNKAGIISGVLGSSIDFTNGLISLTPPGTGVALTITGDTHSSDIQDWFVSGGGSPAVSILSNGAIAGTVGTNHLFWTGGGSDAFVVANTPVSASQPTGNAFLGFGTSVSNIAYTELYSLLEITPASADPCIYRAVLGEGIVNGGTGTCAFVSGVQGNGIATENGTATIAVGVWGQVETATGGSITTTASAIRAASPNFGGPSYPTITNGLEILDQGNAAWASNGIHVLAQTSPGKAIVVDGGLSFFPTLNLTGSAASTTASQIQMGSAVATPSGSSGTAVTTNAAGGSGPAAPTVIVGYIAWYLGTQKIWIPYFE